MLPPYEPNTPLPPDIPAESQDDFVSNFTTANDQYGVDHIPFGNSIITATSAAPTVINSPNHLLTTGDTVEVNHMYGVAEDGTITLWSISGSSFTVTVIDDDNFSLDGSDTSLDPTYNGTGDWNSTTPGYPYGYHKKLSFADFLRATPNLAPTKSSLFTQQVDEIIGDSKEPVIDLAFQNNVTLAAIASLTNIQVFQNANGSYFTTPWGLLVQYGGALSPTRSTDPRTFFFAKAFTSVVYTIILVQNGSSSASGGYSAEPLSLTQFKIHNADNPVGGSFPVIKFSWLAIGK